MQIYLIVVCDYTDCSKINIANFIQHVLLDISRIFKVTGTDTLYFDGPYYQGKC